MANNDFYIVYAWRWSDDDKHAKIGVCKRSKLPNAELDVAIENHPTADPVLIGVLPCKDREQAMNDKQRMLNELFERTVPDNDWVIADADFNHIIRNSFICGSQILKKMFGHHVQTAS